MDPKHEQTTNEAIPSRKRAKKPEVNPQAEMKMHKAEDDVLDVIEGVESQLGALRKAHEDHRTAMKDLAQHKREVEEQANELDSRETELTTREVELAEMRQDFESREMNLVQRASGLEQRESKIASRAELLEQQEADLETKDNTLETKINELDGQLAGLSKRKAELDTLEVQAKEKLAREDQAAIKLKQASKELAQAKSSLESMSTKIDATAEELLESQQAHKAAITELDQSKDAHDTASKELNSAVSKLRGREIELNERSHTLEELAEKAGGLEHDLNTSREEYSEQMTGMTDQLTKEHEVVEQLHSQVKQLENDRDQAVSQSSSQVQQIQSKLKQATSELESMRQAAKELGHQGQESETRVSSLTSELKSSQDQVKELQSQVNEIAACADEELTSERVHVKDLESKIASLSSQMEDGHAKQAKLQTQLDAKPEADPAELASIQAQFESAQEETLAIGIKLEEAHAQAQSAAQAAAQSLESEIAQRDEAIATSEGKIKELMDQSAELFETIEKLGAELEEAQESPKVDVDQWNLDRRTRLKKMRRILTGDAEKIRLATDALRSRYDQCEQVLTKRAELAEAYEAISSAQRKYQGREVRSGVFLGLIGISAITLVLAFASWFVAGRMAPGMYAAKVTMAAASGDTTITESDMEQWEVYISALATDARFIEVAADRMKRRGIAEFAIPGELAREMEQSLDVVSAMPGTMVMEYRGEGAERTQRVLDTFAVALSSAANNARARRADSSLTIIEAPAVSSDSPLDTRRIETAGMIFGSGMLLTLITGGVLWKKLSAAKAKFENDSRVTGILDDSQWEMPG